MRWTDMQKQVAERRPDIIDGIVYDKDSCEYTKEYVMSVELADDMPPNEVITVISAETLDRHGDVVVAEGGNFQYWMKNPVVLFGHNYDGLPVGQGLWIKGREKDIVSRFRFNEVAFSQDVNKLVKSGDLRAVSIGFMPMEAEWIKDEDGNETNGIKFTKWELLEYSVVPVPANREALMVAVGKGMKVTDKMKEELKIMDTEEIVEANTDVNAPEDETNEGVEIPSTEEETVDDDGVSEDVDPEKSVHDEIVEQFTEKLAEEYPVEDTQDVPPGYEANPEEKAGQVLSAKNKGLLSTAQKNIQAVLDSAGGEDDKSIDELKPIKEELDSLKGSIDELTKILDGMRKDNKDIVAELNDKGKAVAEETDKESGVDSEAVIGRIVSRVIAERLGKVDRGRE